MEHTAESLTYVGPSFFLEVRQRLDEIGADFWIEKIWRPSLQREGDCSLMEVFSHIKGITQGQLEKLNEVRLFLRVITIADLANPDGTHIPDGMLVGDWQAGSDLLWPERPKPLKAWWALFRKCLRLTLCKTTNPHQKPAYSMALDKKLGR